jgi:hypothetical protein
MHTNYNRATVHLKKFLYINLSAGKRREREREKKLALKCGNWRWRELRDLSSNNEKVNGAPKGFSLNSISIAAHANVA